MSGARPVAVLFLGAPDALSLSLRARLAKAGVLVASYDVGDLMNSPGSVFRAMADMGAYQGVAPNFFSRSSQGATDEAIRLVAEWTAFIGSSLYAHPNVINPPRNGMWSGALPIYPDFFQEVDSSVLVALNAGQFSSVELLKEYTAAAVDGSKEWLRFPHSAEMSRLPSQLVKSIFIDDFVLVEPENVPDALHEDVRYLVYICTKHLGLRMGEIGIICSSVCAEVDYVLARPQIQNFGFYKASEFIGSLAVRLSCGFR